MNLIYIVFLYGLPTFYFLASLFVFVVFKVKTRKIPAGYYLPEQYRVKVIVTVVAASLSGIITIMFTYFNIVSGLLPVMVPGVILNLIMQYLLIGLLKWLIGLSLLSVYIKKMSKHIEEQENK